MGLSLGIGLGIPYGGRPPTAVVRLAAPATLDVTENATTVDLDWSDVIGAASYEYNVGSGWNNVDTDTAVADVAVPYGAGIARARAVDGLGVRGRQKRTLFYIDFPIPSAPRTPTVDPTYLDYEFTWIAPLTNAAYVTGYQVRLDAGAWEDVGLVLSYSGTGAAGSHTASVRAYNVDAAFSSVATSASFDLEEYVEPPPPGDGWWPGSTFEYAGSQANYAGYGAEPVESDAMWTPSGDPMWTPSGDSMWT